LTQNVPGMIYQFQMESDGTSHFPYVSKGGEDIYGFSANLKLPPSGRKASSVIHPDDALRVAKTIVESAQQLTLWRQEYRVCLPERGERWVSGVARPQPLESGAVLWHGYIQDITEQKHQAMELEEAQRMLQHLLHAMPVALCMVDESRHIYFRNQRFLDYFGYTESQVPSMDEWAVFAYPDPACLPQPGGLRVAPSAGLCRHARWLHPQPGVPHHRRQRQRADHGHRRRAVWQQPAGDLCRSHGRASAQRSTGENGLY